MVIAALLPKQLAADARYVLCEEATSNLLSGLRLHGSRMPAEHESEIQSRGLSKVRETRAALCLSCLTWIVLALISPHSHAHLLNMTELHLDASDRSQTVLRVKIDLGQSLMHPEEYWRAATADAKGQEQLIAPAVEQFLEALVIAIDSVPAAATLQSWQLEAVSIDAIRNPITPQMAELIFLLDQNISLGEAELEVRIDDNLEVPWPVLLRVDYAVTPLPVSRLLTSSERSSRPIILNGNLLASDSATLAGLALAFQNWVPGLSWLAVGFQHIIPRGLDHIVFVLGLFFLSTRLSTLLYQVSCFTMAHSLALALATLGIVAVPAAVVEPLIAASIIFVAVDNLHSNTLIRWRLLVVTLFGLLHGLGFAAVLSELILPAENFYSALLFFNLGVEAGQLTVLLLAFAAVGWLRNWSQYTNRVARPATVTIAGVGAYWLVKRVAFI